MPVETPEDEAIVSRLSGDIGRLAAGETLIIAEFHTSNATVWRVSVDECGVPHVRCHSATWDSLQQQGRLDERAVLAFIRPDEGMPLVLIRTGPRFGYPVEGDADRALDVARQAYEPTARAFRCETPVDDLLKEATARVPLPSSVWYELIMLSRRQSGGIELAAEQLFLPEERRGEIRELTVQVEPSDHHGTVFAVAARNPASEFQLLSMQSAAVKPGTYRITARLARPGVVRFDGLPVALQPERRSWPEVIATIPERVEVVPPAHLIIAIETLGSPEDFQERVYRASQLASDVAAAPNTAVCFSVLTYGAHLHDRAAADEPVRALCEAEPDAGMLERCLEWLHTRPPARPGRTPGAQVECLLAEVTELLRKPRVSSAGRPVLVTIGGLPAFPHRTDLSSSLLPCPWKQDWRALLRGLSRSHAGMAFGAIRDGKEDDDDFFNADPADIWRFLGNDAYVRASAFDPHQFAVDLGLLSSTLTYLPFPLAVPERAE